VDVTSNVDPLTWIPCTNGMTDCQEATSVDGCGSRFGASNEASRGPAGAAKWLHLQRERGPAVYEDIVIDVATSATLAAFRYDTRSHCSIRAALGQSLVAAFGVWQDGGAYAYGAPADLMGSSPPPFLSLPAFAPPGYIPEMSDTTFALGGAFTERAPLGSTALIDPGIPPKFYGRTPVVVGDDVFVNAEVGQGEWLTEYRLDPDGSTVLFRGPPNTHASAFATDGKTMFWTESSGDVDGGFVQPSLEVWAAPYTSDPAQLATTAHRLAQLPLGQPAQVPVVGAIAFEGIYVLAYGNETTYQSTAYLVRATDGALKTVTSGPGRMFGQPLIVTPTELWSIEGNLSAGGERLTRIAYGGWP
jgi:hypothetical protein